MKIDRDANVILEDGEEFMCGGCAKRFAAFKDVKDTSCMTWLHVVRVGTNQSVAFTPYGKGIK